MNQKLVIVLAFGEGGGVVTSLGLRRKDFGASWLWGFSVVLASGHMGISWNGTTGDLGFCIASLFVYWLESGTGQG